MRAFKVGDVCVGHSFTYAVELNGMECVVKDFHPQKYGRLRGSGRRYGPQPMWFVEWANGHWGWQDQTRIKLKRPPSWNSWLFDTSSVKDEPPIALTPAVKA